MKNSCLMRNEDERNNMYEPSLKEKRKNVLFITADQWRGDCLGCLGHPLLKTPNLDQLASEGVIFKKHFAQTVPCGPSRASLFLSLIHI